MAFCRQLELDRIFDFTSKKRKKMILFYLMILFSISCCCSVCTNSVYFRFESLRRQSSFFSGHPWTRTKRMHKTSHANIMTAFNQTSVVVEWMTATNWTDHRRVTIIVPNTNKNMTSTTWHLLYLDVSSLLKPQSETRGWLFVTGTTFYSKKKTIYSKQIRK